MSDNHVKPIEEVREVINIVKDEMTIIRSDIAYIKNRLNEIFKEREEMEKLEEDNISKGWGWGFY